DGSSTFDFSANYSLPIWGSLEPWVKFELRNLFNDDTQIGGNDDDLIPNFAGPLDSNGLPTTFTLGPSFGNATGNGSFVTPREYRVSAGIRF
ncbi:MAG: hypothetical protein AAGD01_20555, partial [Acidobacteriota bacterium]